MLCPSGDEKCGLAPRIKFDAQKNLSAEQSSPGQETRFPHADEDSRRAAHPLRPAREGPACAHRQLGEITLPRPVATGGHRFPKSRRLLKRGEFDRVYREGARWSNAYFAAVFRKAEDEGPGRVGLAVGRRLGGAVVRNRIKRRLREAIRGRFDEFPSGWDIVFQARRRIGEASATELDAEIQRTFRRAAASEFSGANPRRNP